MLGLDSPANLPVTVLSELWIRVLGTFIESNSGYFVTGYQMCRCSLLI